MCVEVNSKPKVKHFIHRVVSLYKPTSLAGWANNNHGYA